MSDLPRYAPAMKLNCVINTGKIVNRFGNALLIKRPEPSWRSATRAS